MCAAATPNFSALPWIVSTRRESDDMHATLCLHLPDQPALLRVLDPAIGEVSLGREEGCTLTIGHASVSRRHAALRHDGGDWWVQDLGSTNGVRIGGHRIDRQKLRHGEWFSLGDVFCEFRLVAEAELVSINARSEQRRQTSGMWLGRLAQAPDREALLAGLVAAIVQLAECRRGFILAGSLDKGFSTVACCGIDADAPGRRDFAGSTGALARAIHQRTPLLISDPAALDWARGRQSIVAGGLRALVALPILHQDRLLGVAYADSDVPGKLFTELDRDILGAFTEQVGLLLAVRGLDEMLARLESCIQADASGQPDGTVAAPYWSRLA
jgi:FHA domain/GAF domain